jgi:uncharacterized protein YjaZ
MKIIEALKELKLVEKKMAANIEDIQKYSSGINIEKSVFGTETEHKREVAGLIQSNLDLAQRYADLKMHIENTNLVTYITIDGLAHSIAQWLIIKRKLGQYYVATYNALNDSVGRNKLKLASRSDDSERIEVVRYYEERDVNEQRRRWRDLIHNIEAQLEIVNATQDIVEIVR